jgi:hypothetical protein
MIRILSLMSSTRPCPRCELGVLELTTREDSSTRLASAIASFAGYVLGETMSVMGTSQALFGKSAVAVRLRCQGGLPTGTAPDSGSARPRGRRPTQANRGDLKRATRRAESCRPRHPETKGIRKTAGTFFILQQQPEAMLRGVGYLNRGKWRRQALRMSFPCSCTKRRAASFPDRRKPSKVSPGGTP